MTTPESQGNLAEQLHKHVGGYWHRTGGLYFMEASVALRDRAAELLGQNGMSHSKLPEIEGGPLTLCMTREEAAKAVDLTQTQGFGVDGKTSFLADQLEKKDGKDWQSEAIFARRSGTRGR